VAVRAVLVSSAAINPRQCPLHPTAPPQVLSPVAVPARPHALQAFSSPPSTPRPPSSRTFSPPRRSNLPPSSSPTPSQQPNPVTQAVVTDHWVKLILSYARYRKLWTLRLEDTQSARSDWHEITRNDRIKRMAVPFCSFSHTNNASRSTFAFPSVRDPGRHGPTRVRSLRALQANQLRAPLLASPRRVGRCPSPLGMSPLC
jgi:hypothetical protein